MVIHQVTHNELTDNQLEIFIESGRNVPPPSPSEKTVSSYLWLEFPYPSVESPQKFKSKTISNNVHPKWNATWIVKIDRKKSLLRVVQKKKVHVEVFHASGWFSRDKCVGEYLVCLQYSIVFC